MPQDKTIPWGDPPPEKSATPPAPAAKSIPWGDQPVAQASTAPGPPEAPSGNFLTRPLSETLGGASATKKFEEAAQRLMPEGMKKDLGNSWMFKFGKELAKGGPEVLDFVQSPVGMALTAAHLFPASAPFASIVDIGLGGVGMMETFPAASKALSDKTPESWAKAVKTLAFSTGMIKGGMKSAAASAMKYRPEPLEAREALREGIQKQPPSVHALAQVMEKHKTVDPQMIHDWASKPLSEIEGEQRKARDRHAKLSEELRTKAATEKRSLTGGERLQLKQASQSARVLRDVARAVLPEKMQATELARLQSSPTWSQQAYYNAWLREPAKLINIQKPRLMEVSSDIVFDRASFLAKRNFEVNRMIYDWKKVVPLEDRQIQKMGYVIQGTATPDEVGLSPQARRMLPVIEEWTRSQDRILRTAYGNDLPLQDSDTYLTQAWKPKHGEWTPALKNLASRTLMNDPFLKRKTVESYKYGIEKLNLEPKFNDVFDLLKMRAEFASKAIANRRMASWLRDLGAIVSEPEYLKLRPGGPTPGETAQTPTGVSYGGKAPGPSEWQRADDAVSLYRAAYSNKPLEPGAIAKPVYVHPDFADSVNAIFGKGYNHLIFNALDTTRALGKKTALNFSMFHHWALSEQGHAIYATRRNPASTLSKTFFFNPEFYKGMKSGMWEALGREGDAPPVMRVKPELVSDALEHGLNLKSEEQEHFLYSKMQEMTTNHNAIVRGIGQVAKPVARVLSGWDKALWDYYHQGMMLDAFETIKVDELNRLGNNASPAKVKEVKRAIAEHVNNAFGAVNYEKMMVSPKMRQALNFMFLAPAWTLSNMRVLTSGYENEAGARLVKKYVAGAAASWFVTTQALNWATTGWYKKDDQGKPKPNLTWDNTGAPVTLAGKTLPGLNENAFNIYAGKNQDGSERYVVLGKGFREPLMWALYPNETFWGKVSLPLRGAMTQATGSTPGSGFKEIDLNASTGTQMIQRGKSALDTIGVPFVAREMVQEGLHSAFPEVIRKPQNSSQIAGLPTRKGISYTRAEKLFRDAMDDGDEGRAQDVIDVAIANGVDGRRIKNEYIQNLRRRARMAAQ